MSGGDAACPSDDTLVRFLTGRTPDDERDRIGRHVDICSACAHVLAMPASGRLTGGARAAAGALLGTSFEGGELLAARYRIVKLLGAGGMGEVYEASDLELNERVALKTVRATIADDLRSVERLKSEVQLARKVTHPNVCRIFDFGVHRPEGAPGDAFPFLTMELLRGTTLAHWLVEHGPPTPEQMLAIARQIAAGLAAAHTVGVIHKDLKSENVFLTPSSEPSLRATVTDFGLAAAHDLVDTVSHPVRFSGTPGYVAPERMAGAAATTASDVFALGVVLVDLLTGSLAMRREAEPVLPRELAGLHALARRCRAPRPGERPTLDAIVEELNRLAGASHRGRAPRRRRVVLGAAVAAVAALASIVSLRMLVDRQHPADTHAAMAAPAAAVKRAAVPVSPAPPPVVASVPAPAPPPARHPARHRRAGSAPMPTDAPHKNTVNEPIRTLGPSRAAASGDDAPINVLSNAR